MTEDDLQESKHPSNSQCDQDLNLEEKLQSAHDLTLPQRDDASFIEGIEGTGIAFVTPVIDTKEQELHVPISMFADA